MTRWRSARGGQHASLIHADDLALDLHEQSPEGRCGRLVTFQLQRGESAVRLQFGHPAVHGNRSARQVEVDAFWCQQHRAQDASCLRGIKQPLPQRGQVVQVHEAVGGNDVCVVHGGILGNHNPADLFARGPQACWIS